MSTKDPLDEKGTPLSTLVSMGRDLPAAHDKAAGAVDLACAQLHALFQMFTEIGEKASATTARGLVSELEKIAKAIGALKPDVERLTPALGRHRIDENIAHNKARDAREDADAQRRFATMLVTNSNRLVRTAPFRGFKR